MIKVSVIVPVYNVENYLEECLNSIINQTLKEIEIICIDDGSDDGSLNILRKFEKIDDRINVFSQENSGLAATRNLGIKLSKGEYIYFIDGDDYLELEALDELYRISKRTDCDLIIFKLLNFYDETREKFKSSYYEMSCLNNFKNKLFEYSEVGDKFCNVAVSAPGKFFKKELISDIKFPVGLIFEDNLFFCEVILKSNKIYYYDKYLYNRRIRKNSITTTPNIKFADSIIVMNRVIDLIKESGLYPFYKKVLMEKKLRSSFSRFSQVCDEDKEEYYNLLKIDFNKYYDEFMADDIFLNKINPRYRFIFNSLIESKSYKEFLYSVKLYDSENKIKELKNEKIELNNKIVILEESNKEIFNSKSWRYTKSFRILRNFRIGE